MKLGEITPLDILVGSAISSTTSRGSTERAAIGCDTLEAMTAAALDVFFSYSHRDGELRDEFETHLASLKREGTIHTWHDRKISAGREWEGEIDQHLEAADLILLLISPDFMASDYCFDREMCRALGTSQGGIGAGDSHYPPTDGLEDS